MEQRTFPQYDANKETVVNLVILDQSGSMHHLRPAVVEGFNGTLADIRSAQEKYNETQEHFVSLMLFDTEAQYFLYENTKISDVINLTGEYRPHGGTPLYDAMGDALTRLREQIKDIENCTVIVTVITDGYENASHRFSGSDIKNLVEELTELGWTFAYMGTNHDVNGVADNLSITNVHEFENTYEGMRCNWNFESRANARMYKCINNEFLGCASMSFDDRMTRRRERAKQFFIEVPAERLSPENIKKLEQNEIFVFGSNVLGQHNGGAAAFAVKNFGAVMGQNYGLQGQSFAIPTVGINPQEMQQYIEQFIDFAKANPDKMFLVTKIGCGNSGHPIKLVAGMFEKAKDVQNIKLPQDFWNFIQ